MVTITKEQAWQQPQPSASQQRRTQGRDVPTLQSLSRQCHGPSLKVAVGAWTEALRHQEGATCTIEMCNMYRVVRHSTFRAIKSLDIHRT